MARRRARIDSSDEEQETNYNNPDDDYSEEETPRRHKRQRVDDEEESTARQQKIGKLVNSFVRTLIGLEDRHQVLTKNMISKMLEHEKEKGTGIQFKKHLLAKIRYELTEVFGLDLVEMNQTKDDKKSEDYILISKIGPVLKLQTYNILDKHTLPISELKDTEVTFNNVSNFAPELPRSTKTLISAGFKSLIICIIILHENNVSRFDLTNILESKFDLKFKEHDSYDILGLQTFSNYITELVKQEYLKQLDISQAQGKKKVSRATKNNATDDSLLILSLGRRSLTEFTKSSFINYIKQIYQNWDESLQTKAENAIESLFVAE